MHWYKAFFIATVEVSSYFPTLQFSAVVDLDKLSIYNKQVTLLGLIFCSYLNIFAYLLLLHGSVFISIHFIFKSMVTFATVGFTHTTQNWPNLEYRMAGLDFCK